MIITLFHSCNKWLSNILGIFTRLSLFVLVDVSVSSLCELLEEESGWVRLLAECLPYTRSHLKLFIHFHYRVHSTDCLAHLRTTHRMLHEFLRATPSNLPKVVFYSKSKCYVITNETEPFLKLHILEELMGCLGVERYNDTLSPLALFQQGQNLIVKIYSP